MQSLADGHGMFAGIASPRIVYVAIFFQVFQGDSGGFRAFISLHRLNMLHIDLGVISGHC